MSPEVVVTQLCVRIRRQSGCLSVHLIKGAQPTDWLQGKGDTVSIDTVACLLFHSLSFSFMPVFLSSFTPKILHQLCSSIIVIRVKYSFKQANNSFTLYFLQIYSELTWSHSQLIKWMQNALFCNIRVILNLFCWNLSTLKIHAIKV